MAIPIRTFDSQIDYADGSAALRKLAIRSGRSASKAHVRPIITWILVIGLAVMLLMILNSPSGRRQYGVRLFDLTPVAWMLAGVAVLIVGVKITTIASWRAMRKSSIGKSNAIEIRADDQGISADNDLQRMFYPWCFFTRFAESQKSFALHGRAINWGDWLLFVVPVAPLAETGQVDDFRALLARNILPEARRAKEGSTGFPVVMHEPEAAGNAERPISNGLLATDTRTTVLDQIRFEYEDFKIARLGWRRARLTGRGSIWPKIDRDLRLM